MEKMTPEKTEKITLDKFQENLAKDLVIIEESGYDKEKLKKIESAYMIIYDLLLQARKK